MCGRYTLTLDLDGLIGAFRIDRVEAGHQPRYNLAPGQEAPVIVGRQDERCLVSLRWGLVPTWANPQDWKPLINARAETVAAKPSFRAAFRRRRCLIPADGFYEWEKTAGRKQPWRVLGPGNRPFAMAGLWEAATGEYGGSTGTYAIITTRAAAGVEKIHSRMPVMLAEAENQEAWLWEDDLSFLRRMLAPPEEDLVLYPVSSQVNSPRHEDPSLIEDMSADRGPGPTLSG